MKRIYGNCAGLILALMAIPGCHQQPAQGGGSALHGDVVQNTEQARAETERAVQLTSEGKYAQAEPILKRAIQLDPMYGPAHNDLGLVYFHENRLYDAAWEYENAAKLMPRQPQPRNNLGLVLEQAEQLKEAVAAYTEAWQLAPDNPEYIGNLARARIRLGDKDEETIKLLQDLVLRDTRPDWVEWARSNLLRLRGTILESRPKTSGSTGTPQ
jgi:Flp pilus assembly protein TadD